MAGSTEIALLQRDVKELREQMEKKTDRIVTLEAQMKKYDKMATKGGGIVLGLIIAGAMFANGFEKLRDKLLGYIMQ